MAVSFCQRYTGVWEGESISQSNEETHWLQTFLVFTPRGDTGDEDRQEVVAEGRGVSRWRGLEINFLLSGEVTGFANQSSEVQFRFTKQHTGRYTNRVSYGGSISATQLSSLPPLSLTGEYASGNSSNGRLLLRQSQSGPPPTFLGSGGGGSGLALALGVESTSFLVARALSGKWGGASRSASDTTEWGQMSLVFTPLATSVRGGRGFRLRVAGGGVSQWRGQDIPFEVEGVVEMTPPLTPPAMQRGDDCVMAVQLTKRHTGPRFTNIVRYKAILKLLSSSPPTSSSPLILASAENASEHALPRVRSCAVMEGGYDLGTFALEHLGDRGTAAHTSSNGASGGCGGGGAAAVSGGGCGGGVDVYEGSPGQYLWESARFRLARLAASSLLASLQPTNAAAAAENSMVEQQREQSASASATASGGSAYGGPNSGPNSGACPFAGQGSSGVVAAVSGGRLDGLWEGESVDHSGACTKWAETELFFRSPTTAATFTTAATTFTTSSSVCARGKGHSVWRNQRIPFNVRAQLDLRRGTVGVEKQHTGAYTNQVRYRCHLLALSPGPMFQEFERKWAAASAPSPSSTTTVPLAAEGDDNAARGGARQSRSLAAFIDCHRFALWGHSEPPLPPSSVSPSSPSPISRRPLTTDTTSASSSPLAGGGGGGVAVWHSIDLNVRSVVVVVGTYAKGRIRLTNRLSPRLATGNTTPQHLVGSSPLSPHTGHRAHASVDTSRPSNVSAASSVASSAASSASTTLRNHRNTHSSSSSSSSSEDGGGEHKSGRANDEGAGSLGPSSPRGEEEEQALGARQRATELCRERQAAVHGYRSFLAGVLAASGHEQQEPLLAAADHAADRSVSQSDFLGTASGVRPGRRRRVVCLTEAQQRAVGKERGRVGVTLAEHEAVLKDLGVSSLEHASGGALGAQTAQGSEGFGDEEKDSRLGTARKSDECRHEESKLEHGVGNERATCVFCLDAAPTLACVPCGHVCMCDQDAKVFAAQATDLRCPICRNPVQCTMRVYM